MRFTIVDRNQAAAASSGGTLAGTEDGHMRETRNTSIAGDHEGSLERALLEAAAYAALQVVELPYR